MGRLIYEDKAIAKIDLSYLTLSLLIGQEASRIAVAEIKRLLRETPTVNAEPIRRGQWNKEEDTLFRLCVYKCSLCGGEVLSEAYLFKYCPYCGCAIKMEVEEDEID